MRDRRYRIEHTIAAETETVCAVLKAMGWRECTDDSWDLLWSNWVPHASVYRRSRHPRRINHLPGIDPMILKDSLHDHLALELVPGPETQLPWVFPRSFTLPRDRAEVTEFARSRPDLVWIVKPRDGSMGRGIRLVRSSADLVDDPDLVVQEYMDSPLVFAEAPAKHVLRVYVLIESVAPLRAFVHRECTVKVASRRYVPAHVDPRDVVVHLTNPTIQVQNTDVDDPIRAIDMDTYAARLESVGHDVETLRDRLRRLVADLLSVFAEPVTTLSTLFSPDPRSGFELLGLDVVVDTALRPWLLECNLSPSLATRSPAGTVAGDAQRRAKHRVIRDLFSLVLDPVGDPGGFERVAVDGRAPSGAGRTSAS